MTYLRNFTSKSEASRFMNMKNLYASKANNNKDLFCVVSGPQNSYSVVDFKTARESGLRILVS